MNNNWNEILLYPAISAVVFSGILLFGDWRRGKLDTVWSYVLLAFAFFCHYGYREILLYAEKEIVSNSDLFALK